MFNAAKDEETHSNGAVAKRQENIVEVTTHLQGLRSAQLWVTLCCFVANMLLLFQINQAGKFVYVIFCKNFRLPKLYSSLNLSYCLVERHSTTVYNINNTQFLRIKGSVSACSSGKDIRTNVSAQMLQNMSSFRTSNDTQHSLNAFELLSSQYCFSFRKISFWNEHRTVVTKLFLITYHLWDPYCHYVPPCYRKAQSTKYHSIKSLENKELTQMWLENNGCEKLQWLFLKKQHGKYTKTQELITVTEPEK